MARSWYAARTGASWASLWRRKARARAVAVSQDDLHSCEVEMYARNSEMDWEGSVRECVSGGNWEGVWWWERMSTMIPIFHTISSRHGQTLQHSIQICPQPRRGLQSHQRTIGFWERRFRSQCCEEWIIVDVSCPFWIIYSTFQITIQVVSCQTVGVFVGDGMTEWTWFENRNV